MDAQTYALYVSLAYPLFLFVLTYNKPHQIQLFSLGLLDIPKVDPHNNIADALVVMYQNMGDALALQYGGYIAHNIVFLERYGRETLTLGVEF